MPRQGRQPSRPALQAALHHACTVLPPVYWFRAWPQVLEGRTPGDLDPGVEQGSCAMNSKTLASILIREHSRPFVIVARGEQLTRVVYSKNHIPFLVSPGHELRRNRLLVRPGL
jgi:hypothetical protein